jgi:transposase
MKISGQFQNVNTARHYAAIKTYVETCRKNGVNEMFALTRLLADTPVGVAEIFG